MRYTRLALIAAAMFTITGTAAAQQPAPRLETGKWTGTIVPPEGEPATVAYDISYAGDTLKIKINAGDHGSFDAWEAKAEEGKISFKFRPGPEVVCVLKKVEKSYSGVCTAEDGSTATMDLSPPKKEGA
jgi:hypothetical protein